MVTGVGTLPLLCKKSQAFPADVCTLVQQYLRVHVGQRCPQWIDGLLVQQLQGLEPDSEVVFTLCSSLRLDFTSRYNWEWKGDAGANEDTDVCVCQIYAVVDRIFLDSGLRAERRCTASRLWHGSKLQNSTAKHPELS